MPVDDGESVEHYPGLFITIEGCEGSGKTTQARLLAEWLSDTKGREVVQTREPGGTVIGRQLREIIFQKGVVQMAELLLYGADRAQHVEALLLPSLRAGKTVVCDRFVDSTMAYQHFGRGIPWDTVRQLVKQSSMDLVPDLTILIDVNPVDGLLRKSRQGDEWTKFEGESAKFHQDVYNGFKQLAQRAAFRFHVVDGKAPVAEIHQEIRRGVEAHLDGTRRSD